MTRPGLRTTAAVRGIGAAWLLVGCAVRPTLAPTPMPTTTPLSPAIATEVAPTATSSFLYSREELQPIALELIAKINGERNRQGLAPLLPEESMSALAFTRSEDMVERDYFSHEDPQDGSNPAALLLPALGFGGRLSEIIFATTGSLPDVPQAAVDWWMNSEVHRNNLLEPNFHFVGVGLMGDGTWWKVTGLLAEAGP